MAKLYSQYLNDNRDFLKFIDGVSDNTGKRHNGLWLKNLWLNREFLKSREWATEKFQTTGKGKASIIMGSSPAIRKQVQTLREIQDDPDFILCGMSSNLGFLLDNGIKPKFAIVVDADPSSGKDWENIDMEKTKDIPLIANVYAYPEMLKRWKGPIHPIAFTQGEGKVYNKQKKWYDPINGNGKGFPALMGQFNIMTAFVFSCLESNIILFVGNELSYQDDNSRYYVDRPDPRDYDPRRPHGDIYGNIVYTTSSLYALKIALEAFLNAIAKAGWFFNCTEAGIFGVSKRYPGQRMPWIQQFTLKTGIAQARHIMRTGEPYYETSMIKEVSNERFWRTLSPI